MPQSYATALLAAHAALDKQAEDVVVMDVRALSSVTDYVVVCSAGSARQLGALKDHIETELAKRTQRVWHVEGASGPPAAAAAPWVPQPQWILMDCGDIIVHLLDQDTRAFYRLEDVWADAPRISVSDLPPKPQEHTGQRQSA